MGAAEAAETEVVAEAVEAEVIAEAEVAPKSEIRATTEAVLEPEVAEPEVILETKIPEVDIKPPHRDPIITTAEIEQTLLKEEAQKERLRAESITNWVLGGVVISGIIFTLMK